MVHSRFQTRFAHKPFMVPKSLCQQERSSVQRRESKKNQPWHTITLRNDNSYLGFISRDLRKAVQKSDTRFCENHQIKLKNQNFQYCVLLILSSVIPPFGLLAFASPGEDKLQNPLQQSRRHIGGFARLSLAM